MERDSVKRIALTGELPGAAFIRRRAGKQVTEIRFSLRGRTDGLTLFYLGEGGVRQTRLPREGAPVVTLEGGAEPIALTRGGRIVSACPKGRGGARLMDEIRIRAACMEREEASKNGNGGDPIKTAPEKPGEKIPEKAAGKAPEKAAEKAPEKAAGKADPFVGARTNPIRPRNMRDPAKVTLGILEQAERLFGMLEGAGIIKEEPREKERETKEEEGLFRVPNPFPRTYPDSVWKKREGEPALYGSILREGGLAELVAFPAMRGRPAKALGKAVFPRPIAARDGRRYWVFEGPTPSRS